MFAVLAQLGHAVVIHRVLRAVGIRNTLLASVDLAVQAVTGLFIAGIRGASVEVVTGLFGIRDIPVNIAFIHCTQVHVITSRARYMHAYLFRGLTYFRGQQFRVALARYTFILGTTNTIITIRVSRTELTFRKRALVQVHAALVRTASVHGA